MFEQFAELVKSSWMSQLEINESPELISYTAFLEGEIAEALPRHYQRQRFLENDLEPICKLLNIEFEIAAQVLAMRNAWLGLFENYVNLKIRNEEKNTIISKDNVKAVTDFLILNSPFWTEHHNISEVVASLVAEQVRVNSKIEEDRKQNVANGHNPAFIALLNKNREKSLEDIEFCIDEFHLEDNKFKSFEEMDAWNAQLEINKAQRKIRELQQEVGRQENSIRQADETILKFKRLALVEKNAKGRGRPESSEYNVAIGKKFVSQWVKSLMEALDVKSCQKLEELICPYTTKLEFNKAINKTEERTIPSRATERNWRRWLKGEAIPNYKTFEILMGTKIDFGKCKGQLLQDMPTTPNSNDLQTLLRFI